MIHKIEGNLFHIDFGHFLGNVKKKFGVKRERDPFVLTKEMVAFINIDLEDKIKSGFKTERSGSPEKHSFDEPSVEDLQVINEQTMKDENDDIPNDDKWYKKKKTKNFIIFEKLCCKAYNILRKEGHRFINMFLIMLSAGMPELSKELDIQYIVNALKLDYTNQEASVHFKKEIERASRTWSRRFDNFLHNYKAKFKK